MPTRRTVIVIVILVVAASAALFVIKGNIPKQLYYGQGRRITSSLAPKIEEKYREDLRYTLDKFWSCYESGIVSQKDLTDVMERMKRLGSDGEISDSEIFELIGYISRLYTDEIRKYHEETMEKPETE
ncbi:MAG: hypothetical protein JW746_06120 [Candidatus Krumholzibacteriota bacterium]|nr:hypothetical protein [Candidatus Krumholzibacteriota bacterium]